MSIVVFPFKEEDPGVLLDNVRAAAVHPRVREVVCVGFERESTFEALERAAPGITEDTGTKLTVVVQQRLGSKRPGKGDGMNTALRYFLDETDAARLHFYDSDIRSFTGEWIERAEHVADDGYDVVRHYFPRASTDAMITWMITRTGLAILWPHSELAWIEQPLGGELLLTRPVVERFAADGAVRAQSDWGIDTLYTFAAVRHGFSMFETHVREGKVHRLYGRLTDLKTMLVECFSALQELRGTPVPGDTLHRIDYPDVVPVEIGEKIGYDVEESILLLPLGWTDRQNDLLELFPIPVRDGMLATRGYPRFGFMDERNWGDTYRVLLDHFIPGDGDWEELLFRLWVVRVLNYTINQALRGYSHALRYLHWMVDHYRRAALQGSF